MQFKKVNRIVSIVGKKGKGKTTFTKEQIKNIPRVFIVDTQAEYDGDVIDTFEELMKPTCVIWKALSNGNFCISFRNRSNEQINFALRLVFAIGNMTLVADESERYLDLNPQSNAPFNECIFYGRHKDLDVFALAHRPILLSTNLRSQVDTKIFFGLEEVEGDRQVIESFGLDFDEILNLQVGQYKLVGNPLT
jgi:hypothetical protein